MSDDSKRRWVPLLIRALLGICILVLVQRLSLAVALDGWDKGWSVGMVWALSLTPAAAFAVVAFLTWRHRRNQSTDP